MPVNINREVKIWSKYGDSVEWEVKKNNIAITFNIGR